MLIQLVILRQYILVILLMFWIGMMRMPSFLNYFPTSLLLVIAFVSNQSPLDIPPLLRSKSIDYDLNTLSDYVPLTLVMDMIYAACQIPPIGNSDRLQIIMCKLQFFSIVLIISFTPLCCPLCCPLSNTPTSPVSFIDLLLLYYPYPFTLPLLKTPTNAISNLINFVKIRQ